MSLGDWGTIGAFVVKRIDQVSSFLKKRDRINEVDKIDKAVNAGDDGVVGDELRSIVKQSEDRRKANS